jgi:AraC family transcriptional regulator
VVVKGGLSRRVLRAACDRIEAGIEDGVSLDELALEANLSRSHFARAFRQTTGLSPHRYLTARRLARARELLRDENLPLADVALGCGFSSQAHFTETFRRAAGVTPAAFRRSFR